MAISISLLSFDMHAHGHTSDDKLWGLEIIAGSSSHRRTRWSIRWKDAPADNQPASWLNCIIHSCSIIIYFCTMCLKLLNSTSEIFTLTFLSLMLHPQWLPRRFAYERECFACHICLHPHSRQTVKNKGITFSDTASVTHHNTRPSGGSKASP